MTLTAHAIVGASVASLMPSHPVLGFATGFASHFLLDAIPHWDYRLASVKEDSSNPMNNDIFFNINFIFDLFKMSLDAILGIFIALFLFGFSNLNPASAIFWGAIGALAPDALQFVYLKWKHEPIVSIHQFHILRVHSKKSFNDSPILGIFLQIVVIVFFVTIAKFLMH